MVGSFSLFDNFGGPVAQGRTHRCPTSPCPSTWPRPPAQFLQPGPDGQRLDTRAPGLLPEEVPRPMSRHAGALVADEPSATVKWTAEKAAMEHLGYKVVYDPTFDISTTNFNQYVINMKNDGVKILFLEQMPENYAAAVIKALNQQNFHPVVVLGGSTYSEELVPDSGGPAAIDGAYMEQNTALYLGEDASGDPGRQHLPHLGAEGVTRLPCRPLHPVRLVVGRAVQPGPQGGGSRSQPGLGAPGAPATSPRSPAGNLVGHGQPGRQGARPTATSSPASSNGKYQRLDDPPVTGPTHGYRCDQPFYYYPAA